MLVNNQDRLEHQLQRERRLFLQAGVAISASMVCSQGLAEQTTVEAAAAATDELRLGIIGLDTSHSPALVKAFNTATSTDEAFRGMRVVAAYPFGSRTIESSASRIPGYTAEVAKHGVVIVDSIQKLLEEVDCVLLETNDGQVHLPQALEVFRASKPVFIDKPVGSNLAETVAIFRAAEHFKVPMFSASSLRYTPGAQAIRAGKVGTVLGCNSYSPFSLEPNHVDLFWYGIHGVESLFTCMGTGCQTVSHTSSHSCQLSIGQWSEGRIGTFRGIASGKTGYGGTAFGEKAIAEIGPYGGYGPLFVEIAKFFRTHESPIDPQETLEIYAFMQAAYASSQQGGGPVRIDDVMAKAAAEADVLLKTAIE